MKRSYVELNINGTVSNDGLESADQFNKIFTKSVEELATNFQLSLMTYREISQLFILKR